MIGLIYIIILSNDAIFDTGELKYVPSPALLQFTKYFVGPLAITLLKCKLKIILIVITLLL